MQLKSKLMSKRSRLGKVFQRAAGWCECGNTELIEWTCEGDSKPAGSRRRREPCPLSVGCA